MRAVVLHVTVCISLLLDQFLNTHGRCAEIYTSRYQFRGGKVPTDCVLPLNLGGVVCCSGPGCTVRNGVTVSEDYQIRQLTSSYGGQNSQFGSFPSSMAFKFPISLTARLAALIVLSISFNRRLRPSTTLPAYSEARDINDGPKVRVSGASAGSSTEYVTALGEEAS